MINKNLYKKNLLKNKKILITGIDGYTGWPLTLAISKKFKNSRILGIDNLKRRSWVKNANSCSANRIYSIQKRINTAKKHGYKNIKFLKGDLTNWSFVKNIFKNFKPDVVIHLASQPSAPFANLSLKNCSFTHYNNNISTLNLLWAIKETKRINLTKFITTTTTGVYGQPKFIIPEGFIKAINKNKKDIISFGNQGSSWYHITKSNDINNLWLANKLWNLDIIDLRTSIVYGVETDDTKKDKILSTRFDFDYFFGVVINRFCAMSVTNYDLTIYGKGLLKRPFISLKDFVLSTVNLIEHKPIKNFEVFNQTTELLSIKNIAKEISSQAKKLGYSCKLNFIKNPRVEKEEYQMRMENKKFLKLLGKKPHSFKNELMGILKTLSVNNKTIIKNKKSFI
jgi:nucleoside-diphosphate-sugar epimerase|tara:strand:- start:6453 stop:7640 length:1188 start_codon:yes stop_codon:yes gene_type:complete